MGMNISIALTPVNGLYFQQLPGRMPYCAPDCALLDVRGRGAYTLVGCAIVHERCSEVGKGAPPMSMPERRENGDVDHLAS